MTHTQRLVGGLLIAGLIAVPAEAGFKSKIKHVGHVVKVGAIYVGVAVAVVAFCAKGGCGN